MTDIAKFHLLSLGSAPRNNTFSWINNKLVVYAGLSDVCIARMKNNDQLVPEAILPVLSKTTFRSLRLVASLSEVKQIEDLKEFEVIATTSDGHLLLLKFVNKRNETDARWSYEIEFEEQIAANKMVDAFAFRNPSKNNQLTICYSTFVRIELYQFDESLNIKSRQFIQMNDSYFIMFNCLSVVPIVSTNGFLCVFGLTNKKLGIYLIDPTKESNNDESFKPHYLDSREAIWNLDVRKDKSADNVDDAFAFEILASTEERVQIWKLQKDAQSDYINAQTTQSFSLETQHRFKFDSFPQLVAHLDSNILITSIEHLCASRWDNQRQVFVVSTRENSIKVYALEDETDTKGSGVWSLKREVCSFGEPSLELCGIFDPTFSPDSKWLLAHSTTGGFYLFKCEDEFNFAPKSVYIGGHGGKVRDLVWHENGDVLLTVGSDKTTRYFKLYPNNHWGQRSRSQIHGHEIRCVTSLGSFGFLSGATEHMFRAFDNRIPCLSIEKAIERIQPLNLTPKTLSDNGQSSADQNSTSNPDVDLSVPLNEELLQSGATVHEEKRKLYGHGNECYTVATNPSKTLVFTAAKGSRPDESQLLVWKVEGWKLLQRFTDHTLTVTSMAVSPDGLYLLTVSRDRSFALYKIDESSDAALQLQIHQKQAHKRVIWSCAWLPNSRAFFTGSRDGFVGFFELNENGTEVKELQRWQIGECVSALDVGERLSNGQQIIVAATEHGDLHVANIENGRIQDKNTQKLSRSEGESQGSLIYAIRYNPARKLFALCTESGVAKVVSL